MKMCTAINLIKIILKRYNKNRFRAVNYRFHIYFLKCYCSSQKQIKKTNFKQDKHRLGIEKNSLIKECTYFNFLNE